MPKKITRKVKAGFIDWFDIAYAGFKWLFDRKIAPKPFRQFLEKNGSKKITNIEIFREPVKSVIQQVLNIISFGYWNQVKDSLNYDDIFHLYMVVTLDDNSEWRIEKNHVVQATRVFDQSGGLEVPLKGKDITLLEFVNNAVELLGQDKAFKYNAKDNNCQVWIFTLLRASNLDTEEAEEFILQDTDQIVGSLPYLAQDIINETTDLAGIGDIIIHGYALPKKRIRRRKYNKR